MSNSYQTPDLASVLRTLAGLAPPNQQASNQQVQGPTFSQDPRLSSTFASYQQQVHEPSLSSLPSSVPAFHTGQHNVPKTKVVDPATIIEWSAGLRCVMRTVAKHDNVLQDIRRMIKVQHEHEEQWWKGREALIERQQARKEGQKKLDDVLKAVGGNVATGVTNTDPEELAKELEIFDLKVYRAQMQMVREMTTRLKGLGVPFFGTKTELVRVAGKALSEPTLFDGHEDEKTLIDEADLIKLQRKMLGILEDMCNE
ncbi:hypothetical protein PVAG01_03486 [Phlyctema vagabunda]|uniref:Uncharacterized protein n=1 Tax=Phlyctema vagabunda TaxID=108571 RepID=A0ABR4PLN4_9HELO